MGFDKVEGWQKFHTSLNAIRSLAVFKDEAERTAVLNKIHTSIEAEQDVAKQLKMANALTELVYSVAPVNLREALKKLPWLSSVFA